jgi:hypothetical protein
MDPDAPDVVEEMLLCRVDVLCRRTIDPDRMGRGPVDVLAATAPRASLVGGSIAGTARLSPSILLEPPGRGNWFWRSLDETEMLLWRSSKLGDGRKSKDPVDNFASSSIVPKEKRLWLLRSVALGGASLVEPARGLAVGT